MEMMTRAVEMNRVTKKITHQFVVDEDYNVPDSKNDIEKIVLSDGSAKINEVKQVENYLRVQGVIEFQMLYAAEGFASAYEAMEGKLPFVEMVYVDNANGEKLDIKDVRVEFQMSLVHSRKVRIKALAELSLEAQIQTIEDIPTDFDCNSTIYKKYVPMELLRLHNSKKDMYRIKEEITIPGTKETIDRMLWSDVKNRKLETRLAVDELQIDGELLVFCFYESPEGKMDWIEQSVPYRGRIDCFGVDETMFHHVKVNLDEVHIEMRADEDGEIRCLGIEGTLQVDLSAYEEEKMEVLHDMYSLQNHCILEKKEVECEQLILQNYSRCKLMERVSVPELNKDILQICHTSGTLQVDNMEKKEDGVLVEGVVHICLFYVKGDDRIPFDTWYGMVPFSHFIECGETGTNFVYHLTSVLEQLSISLQGGEEIEVKAVLSFQGFFKRVKNVELIQNVRMEPIAVEEIEKRPSIVGYTVKAGDDLWSLAKRFYTSEEAICEVNETTEEKIREGDKLLIFKENMSIL